MDDRALLERLRGSDGAEAAFDTIFRTWYAPLVRAAEAMLRDRAAAEEVVQDMMLALWRRRETLEVDESLRAYLYRATRNRALNHLRRQRVEQRGEPYAGDRTATAPIADSALGERELADAIREAVTSLPPRCREVFELSRAHGLTYAEIAKTLEISVKTVEVQMGKALRVLRERLAAWR